MTHITFRWKKGPDDLTPYNEAQPTHALTCSNGMKAKLTRVRAQTAPLHRHGLRPKR